MQIKINNDRVRKNVELFLHILSYFLAHQQRKQLGQRVYRAWVNRVNGEVLFSDLLPEPSRLEKKDWKVILLRCDPEKGKLFFDVMEGEGDQSCFHCKELAPLAYHTVAETIHELNRCAELALEATDTYQQLEDLSHLAIEPSLLQGTHDLMRAAWHPVDRVKAEELLFKQPYGSFLFRKDDYAHWLEESLSSRHESPITCYTLTLIEPQKKVSDITIVCHGDKLLIYNDDPTLSGARYSTLNELLQGIESRCRYPVFH